MFETIGDIPHKLKKIQNGCQKVGVPNRNKGRAGETIRTKTLSYELYCIIIYIWCEVRHRLHSSWYNSIDSVPHFSFVTILLLAPKDFLETTSLVCAPTLEDCWWTSFVVRSRSVSDLCFWFWKVFFANVFPHRFTKNSKNCQSRSRSIITAEGRSAASSRRT